MSVAHDEMVDVKRPEADNGIAHVRNRKVRSLLRLFMQSTASIFREGAMEVQNDIKG